MYFSVFRKVILPHTTTSAVLEGPLTVYFSVFLPARLSLPLSVLLGRSLHQPHHHNGPWAVIIDPLSLSASHSPVSLNVIGLQVGLVPPPPPPPFSLSLVPQSISTSSWPSSGSNASPPPLSLSLSSLFAPHSPRLTLNHGLQVGIVGPGTVFQSVFPPLSVTRTCQYDKTML